MTVQWETLSITYHYQPPAFVSLDRNPLPVKHHLDFYVRMDAVNYRAGMSCSFKNNSFFVAKFQFIGERKG